MTSPARCASAATWLRHQRPRQARSNTSVSPVRARWNMPSVSRRARPDELGDRDPDESSPVTPTLRQGGPRVRGDAQVLSVVQIMPGSWDTSTRRRSPSRTSRAAASPASSQLSIAPAAPSTSRCSSGRRNRRSGCRVADGDPPALEPPTRIGAPTSRRRHPGRVRPTRRPSRSDLGVADRGPLHRLDEVGGDLTADSRGSASCRIRLIAASPLCSLTRSPSAAAAGGARSRDGMRAITSPVTLPLTR